ncbi:cytochrome P450 CYP94D108-like [Miscanthus floridulus]|uniref:cytochrome P450 CYP94D108-like n=1 Tax=Miscanthus floridulus TaxID=154761 RepID=UPI0034592FE2
MVEDLLGGGIFNSDGDQGLQQRKDASHEFSTRSLRSFIADAVRFEVAERLLPLLGRAARDWRTLDVQDVFERFAFDNICSVVAFDEDPACLADHEGTQSSAVEFMRAFDDAQNILIVRLMSLPRSLWWVKRLLNAEPERRMRAALGKIRDYTDRIFRERRERLEAGLARSDDLVSRFAARREHSDESFRDAVTNLLLAGRDTTSSALIPLFKTMVSGRPDVEDRIVREIRTVRESSSGSAADADAVSTGTSTTTPTSFSLDELRDIHYLHAAITESMRLYPPVAINTRRFERDEFLPDGTFVGRGWQVTYSAYAVARVADVWGHDCEEFRPERWFDGGGVFGRPESPFKYPVFHAGLRTCLGKEMAYVQMKSIVACVFERFSLRFVGDEDQCPGLALALTLRMKDGLPMQVYERLDKIGTVYVIHVSSFDRMI